MRNKRYSIYTYAFLTLFIFFYFPINLLSYSKSRPVVKVMPNHAMAVRFDPSYYYDRDQEVDELCETLAQKWSEAGINLLYIKVYDPVYGAVYHTNYSLNIQTDYGRLDLLSAMLKSCHKRNIAVFAWIPAFLHKQVWEAHPEWRIKDKQGNDYQTELEPYLLCTRHQGFRQWWLGFIDELAENYPGLDGFDIAEPIVTWKYDEGCFCDFCQQAYENYLDNGGDKQTLYQIRSKPLLEILEETVHRIHKHGKKVSITTVVSAHENGLLYSSKEQQMLSGFDLDGILNSAQKPDIINTELIWQQWADVYHNEKIFTPQWTWEAVRQILSQVNGRTELIVHVEVTPFGGVKVSQDQILESIRSAFKGGAENIDFYDSHQADEQNLWPELTRVFKAAPKKQVVVYYDPVGENDARQLKVLLNHFNTETQLIPLGKSFSPNDKADVIFYVGVANRSSLPSRFLRTISRTHQTVCWINYNLLHLGKKDLSKLGFQYQGSDEKSQYEVLYKGDHFTKQDSSMNLIRIDNPDQCHVLAQARKDSIEVPYIIQSNHFWYVADLPLSYMIEGGRHIVFADLLHDILNEDHQERHLALVRIEDVNPQSSPESLRGIADFLSSKKIPFSVGLTPFYLDPSTNTAISLSDRPELTKALRYMVSKGGTIVLHGCTHQYRGESCIDYEFWDGIEDQPLFEDSEEYVRNRLDKALDECLHNGIYPLIWETPHYAASLFDYRIISQYFSTSYERRQTSDVLGSDQLLPFVTRSLFTNTLIIPENLGYIPLENPSPENLITAAEKNLAVRDGFASFFFHPFLDIGILKEAVKRIEKLGYTFANVRSFNSCVAGSSCFIATGQNEMKLDLNSQYFEEFYLTHNGKIENRYTSEEKLTEPIHKIVTCPAGWMYIGQALKTKKATFVPSEWNSFLKAPFKIGNLWQTNPLVGTNTPVVPLFIIDPDAQGDEAVSQESLLKTFESVGIDYQTTSVKNFIEIPESVNLIVIPYAAGKQLTEQQNLFIIRELANGNNLILEKETDLSTRIGIVPVGGYKNASTVQDEYYPQVDIHWKENDRYRNFDVPIEYVTYYSERTNQDPLVIGGEYGEGKYLYIATFFDPTTSRGYGRYPYFCDLIQREFDLWPVIKKECAEVYFEPGDREDISIEDLVKMWKESGFRIIYVAGWHVYQQWTYDYERLIKLAHENAMLVYLWLELPHVNQKFWDEHPQWREITATGEEAFVDWRRLMALTIDSCREAVYQELSGLIDRYDWDGINLAELYFESAYDWQTYSPVGPERPENFTPMHPSVRADFRKRYHFDPIDLFNQKSAHYWRQNPKDWNVFEKYREQLVVKLHREFLQFLHRESDQKDLDMEILVTVLDDILGKNIGRGTGTDTKGIIALQNQFPFTLQIEDPAQLWNLKPDRYKLLSDTYGPMMNDGSLILDINIVPFRNLKRSLSPTQQQTGIELNQLMRYAFQDSNRVALYSESTIYTVDLPWISYVLGRNAKENISEFEWQVQTKQTVVANLDPDSQKNIYLDDHFWPAYYKGHIIIPTGNHRIRSLNKIDNLKSTFVSSTRLIDMSGELRQCNLFSQGLDISYESKIRNYIVINEEPIKTLLDGKLFHPKIFNGLVGFTLQLPAGSHMVKIFTKSKGSYSLRNISIITSMSIVAISFMAGSVLLVLYVARFKRRKNV